MKQWEYKIVYESRCAELTKVLNREGHDGWELVQVLEKTQTAIVDPRDKSWIPALFWVQVQDLVFKREFQPSSPYRD